MGVGIGVARGSNVEEGMGVASESREEGLALERGEPVCSVGSVS